MSIHAAAPSPVLYPVGKRRPDYRSSGPKRLSPQLDVKVPVLRNWGKKVVVVIDRYFFDNMNELTDAYAIARNDRNAAITPMSCGICALTLASWRRAAAS